MGREIVAGRQALRRAFQEHFTKAIDDGKDTRSFLSFRKQKEAPVPPPWIYLFHGDESLGKTTAIHYCLAIGDEIADEIKREVKTVLLDLDERLFQHGAIPTDRVALLDLVAETFCEADSDLAGCFSSYKALSEKYRATMQLVPGCLRQIQLDGTINEEESDSFEPAGSNDDALQSVLSAPDLEMYRTGEEKLKESLVSAIGNAAEETLTLFVIDGYENIPPDLELWFRTGVLVPIGPKRNRLMLMVGGTGTALRNFRNEFSDDELFAVNFFDIALTRHSIKLLASKLRIALSDDAVTRIERNTAGIPLLVHDILFYAGQGTDIDELTDSQENVVGEAVRLCASTLDRFLKFTSEPQIRERVFSLAMLAQFNSKALAEVWNIPFADVKHALDSLEKQTSFIKNHTVHPLIRKQIRAMLISEAAKNEQSAFKPLFADFSAGNSRLFRETLTQLQTAIQGAEKRCTDGRYVSSIEQMICGMMWSSPAEAFVHLPGYFLELLLFNYPAAQKLLTRIAEFRPVFTPEDEKIFRQLVSGLSFSDKLLVFKKIKVKAVEEEFVAWLGSVSESMNDFQRALFHHVKAEIALRKSQFAEAMENLDLCFSLLGNSSPEKTIMYEDYVILGHSFHHNGEHRNAIDTFSNAVLIKPDGFATWYLMGLSRMALEEYEGAINALSESVKIDPEHPDAWYSLGLSYIKEKLHEEAVAALRRATETSPERAEVWFELGSAYAVLGQHTEAIKAFRKVVLQQPENADAWILLGNSCSELGTAEESIEAYGKAVSLQPKSVEPLKALGDELYKLERYDEALEYLAQASKLAKKDDEIWNRIALAHIGATEYQKAVDAGKKALTINDKNPETWAVIGDAQMLLENLPEAIEAFEKSVEIEPENAGIWQKLGAIHNKRNQPEAAIDAFKKAVAFDPSLKEVWYTIGKAYESQKQHADAVAAYEKGVQADPANVDCWLHKGDMHTVLEQFEDAFECFSEVVKIDETHIDAWFRRGSAAIGNEMFGEAVQSFEKVVEIETTHAEGWFNLGLACQKLGDTEKAVESFREAVAQDAARTDIWYQLGLSCQSLGEYEEAVTAFEKCSELDATSEEYPTRLGSCYFALNKFTLASAAYAKAVELAPENMETLFQLALSAHSQENYSDAVTHYRTITVKKPDYAEAWFNLALAYHATGEYDSAIDVYKTYTEKWPENSAAFFNLGLAYHAKDDIESAIGSYREAIKLQSDSPDIWYNLGIALHTQEHYGDAIQAYRKVLQYSPDHIDAWFNLGTAYYVWQNYADAVESYTSVVERNPEHYTAWGNIALAHYADNEFQKGYEAAKKAFDINKEELWLIGNMIVGCLFTGDSLQAQDFADRLLVSDGGSVATQVIAEIEKGLKKSPDVEGAEAVIKKLKGIAVTPAE